MNFTEKYNSMKIICILGHREEYLQFEVLKGLVRMEVELIVSTPLNNIQSLINQANNGAYVGVDVLPINQPNYTDDEILEHSKDADYIFVFWNKFANARETSPGGRIYIVDKINQPDKTVVIDGSEWSYSGNKTSVNSGWKNWKDSKNYIKGSPWILNYMRDRAKWYFKSVTFAEDYHENNIIPCPLPFRIEDRKEEFQNLEKDVDLSCVFGQLYTGLRAETNASCTNLKKKLPSKSIMVGQVRPRDKCLELICRSILHADAWGAMMITTRRMETVMNSTAIIGQKWELLYPNDFTDGENIINWENINEFEEKVHFYLKNPDKAIQIGKNGYDHAVKYHTTEKRMEYIFDIIKGKLKWEF